MHHCRIINNNNNTNLTSSRVFDYYNGVVAGATTHLTRSRWHTHLAHYIIHHCGRIDVFCCRVVYAKRLLMATENNCLRFRGNRTSSRHFINILWYDNNMYIITRHQCEYLSEKQLLLFIWVSQKDKNIMIFMIALPYFKKSKTNLYWSVDCWVLLSNKF